MNLITIQQLDDHGHVFRTFTRHVWPGEVDTALDQIRLAYNMDHTRVLVDGARR